MNEYLDPPPNSFENIRSASSPSPDLTERLSHQQQHIEQLAKAMQSLAKSIAQRPTPDYRPLFKAIQAQLATVESSHQSLLQEVVRRDPSDSMHDLIRQVEVVERQSQQTRTALKDQAQLLNEHLGFKMLVFQFGLIGLTTAVLTAMGLYWMPGGFRQTQEKLEIQRNETVVLFGQLKSIQENLGIPVESQSK